MKNTPHSTQALFQLNGIPPIGISLSMRCSIWSP